MSRQVLIIDDDKTWLELAGSALQNAGYNVLTAHNGSEALEKAGEGKVGLIVLDLNLAGESGLTLMNYLKRNHPEAAILLVTGMDHDDITIRSMLDMGADQYLRKGSMEELLVTVGTYFKQLS
jgi:Response regulator containing CheY-like receiver, AAA-type ATPase, and DNA-binding domains